MLKKYLIRCLLKESLWLCDSVSLLCSGATCRGENSIWSRKHTSAHRVPRVLRFKDSVSPFKDNNLFAVPLWIIFLDATWHSFSEICAIDRQTTLWLYTQTWSMYNRSVVLHCSKHLRHHNLDFGYFHPPNEFSKAQNTMLLNNELSICTLMLILIEAQDAKQIREKLTYP